MKKRVRFVPSPVVAPQVELDLALHGEVDVDPRLSDVEVFMCWIAFHQS